MDRKIGAGFLLLVCCAVLATSLKIKSDAKIQESARRLMKQCNQMGCKKLDELFTAMGSNVTALEKNSDSRDKPTIRLLCWLEDVQRSVPFSDPPSKLPCPSDKKGFTRPDLTTFLPKMKNLPETSKCCLDAVTSPVAWKFVKEDVNMSFEEFDLLARAADKMMKIPPKRLELPKTVNNKKKFESLMMELRMNYPTLKDQGTEIMKWAKEQFKEKYLNCQTSSDSDKCDKWATCPAIKMLGPYISSLSAADVERSPREDLCECFKSDQFKPIMDKIYEFKPSIAKKLLSKMKTCPEFLSRLDSLGPLLCYYRDPPKKLTPDQSTTLLNKISQCPGLAKLKKRLTESVTQMNLHEAIQKNPRFVEFLSKKELDKLDKQDLMAILTNRDVTLEKKLKRKLVKRYLGDKKCAELSIEDLDLRVLVQATEALPKCAVKKMMPKVRRDLGLLKNMSPRKSQAVAVVKELLQDLDDTQLMDLPDKFLQAVPTKNLKKATFRSLNNVTKKLWRIGQACYFAKKMKIEVADWYRDPGSLAQCITCKMVKETKDKNVWAMAQGLADASQWLSKNLAGCVAQKLFATLALKRPDYFKTITVEELLVIPTVLLIHLPSKNMKDLPDPVCPDFLKKMEEADLSSLPVNSPSRVGLMNRALRCLGKDLSTLSSDDVKMLGPLFCEVPPSQLKPLQPVVRQSRLRDLTSCDYIPKKHRKAVAQLVIDTFGESDTWSDIIWEEMGPLLFLDENTKCPQLRKQELKDALQFVLKPKRGLDNPFLKRCRFKLFVSDSESEGSSTVTRRKREANLNNHRSQRADGGSSNTTNTSTVVLTVELIKELGEMNDNWTPQQLDNMTQETFTEAVEVLGNVNSYNPQQLEVLRNKSIETWGDAGSMNESVVTQLGCIAQGFTTDELKMMALSQSSLEDIASCGWNPAQISAVWKGAAKHNDLSPERLDASDLVEIGHFICGLSSSEIQQLNTTAFKDAVESITDVVCTAEVFQQFKALVVDAFGAPSTWTEGDLSNMGTFVAALSATEFSSLDVSVYSFLSDESIPLIPPENFAALTVARLEALGPDKAARVTNDQKKVMTDKQLGALTRAIEGSREQTQSEIPAESQAAEEMGASVKLLLFSLVGFVLL